MIDPPRNPPQPRALPGRAWRTKPPSKTKARPHKTRAAPIEVRLPAIGPFADFLLTTVRNVSQLRQQYNTLPFNTVVVIRNADTGFEFKTNTSQPLDDEDLDYLIEGQPTPEGDWFLPANHRRHASTRKDATTMTAATTPVEDAPGSRTGADATPATPQVTIYTDGACKGNPGPAAFGVVLVSGSPDAATQRSLANQLANMTAAKANGHSAKAFAEPIGIATNNAAELAAVLAGLKYIVKTGIAVTVLTDSRNVIGWLSEGWKRKNPEICRIAGEIDAVIETKRLTVTCQHVKGHAGDPLNTLCDRLTSQAATLS